MVIPTFRPLCRSFRDNAAISAFLTGNIVLVSCQDVNMPLRFSKNKPRSPLLTFTPPSKLNRKMRLNSPRKLWISSNLKWYDSLPLLISVSLILSSPSLKKGYQGTVVVLLEAKGINALAEEMFGQLLKRSQTRWIFAVLDGEASEGELNVAKVCLVEQNEIMYLH